MNAAQMTSEAIVLLPAIRPDNSQGANARPSSSQPRCSANPSHIMNAPTFTTFRRVSREPVTFCCNCHRMQVGPLTYVEVSPQERVQMEDQASHGVCPRCAMDLYGLTWDQCVNAANRAASKKAELLEELSLAAAL
jgi:hypothetical protein